MIRSVATGGVFVTRGFPYSFPSGFTSCVGGVPRASFRSFLRARDKIGPMLFTGMFRSVLISS
jgi:hypothetical protein